jgi:hypothetical protein
VERCILYLTSQHFPSLRKETGKYAKNVTLGEIQKNLKNLFATHEAIFNFSKQFLTQLKQRI